MVAASLRPEVTFTDLHLRDYRPHSNNIYKVYNFFNKAYMWRIVKLFRPTPLCIQEPPFLAYFYKLLSPRFVTTIAPA